MRSLVSAELLKLRSTRTAWIPLAVALGFAVIAVVASTAEPGHGSTAHLSPAALPGLLRGLADQGRTVFVSSHLLAELAQTVDDVVIINQGRLVTAGPMIELLEHAKASSLEEFFLAATAPHAPSAHPAFTRPRSLS